jgi:hypothetical protein
LREIRVVSAAEPVRNCCSKGVLWNVECDGSGVNCRQMLWDGAAAGPMHWGSFPAQWGRVIIKCTSFIASARLT